MYTEKDCTVFYLELYFFIILAYLITCHYIDKAYGIWDKSISHLELEK